VAQPLPALTEVLSLANAHALCHVVVDRWGMMTITATSMERGGSVTTQRSRSESPWNREAVAAWAVEALLLEDVREVAHVQRGNGYVLLFR
jgi:hypothetical protein